MGVPAVPTRSPLTPFVKPAPVPLPIKLLPSLVNVPSTSGFNGAVFPAMMVLRTFAVKVLKMPPPWFVALLRVRVLLLRSSVPPFLIAPKLVAVFAENVLLVMVAAPLLTMPPPFCAAWLPLNVLLVTLNGWASFLIAPPSAAEILLVKVLSAMLNSSPPPRW
ncbi:hypothetical protein E5S67_04678 [Microcoleus sp. IPMA8]|uniref:Uncharacterized protein n=1 Tax=Microcoleus asticus IPMA8 TaxID=2563858 RepID=A0ABX2D2Q1_9CYAN|nr:hypothetical protein [Microcoleus asticus IPMA8]